MEPESDRRQLAVDRGEQGGVQVVELDGELDMNSVAELEAALRGASGERVCLDLSELAFIDSSGLAAVVRWHLAITEAGGAMSIVAPAGVVRRTLETSGLLALLSVVDDRATALANLA